MIALAIAFAGCATEADRGDEVGETDQAATSCQILREIKTTGISATSCAVNAGSRCRAWFGSTASVRSTMFWDRVCYTDCVIQQCRVGCPC